MRAKMHQFVCVAGVLCFALALCAKPLASAADPESEAEASDKPRLDEQRVSVDVARDRAKLMHQIYSSTLEMMHQRYFHGDRATVPARALEDVFAALDRSTNVKARWISVNTKPMSIGHEPQNDFERQAAKELSAGKNEFEAVEGGTYQRVGAIALGQGCIGCHTGFFGKPGNTPRFAGLAISIPIVED